MSQIHRRFKNSKHDTTNNDDGKETTMFSSSKILRSRLCNSVWTSYHTYITLSMLGMILLIYPFTTHTTSDRSIDAITANNIQLRSTFNERTIAYVVTITSCNGHEKDRTFQIVEGASVLRYSIHMNSMYGTNGGTYDYQMYAFYHPDAIDCANALTELGYIIHPRPTPVAVSDIQNPELRERIVKNGCCGEKELIKFEAFTLIQHPLVVLLDIDILVLKPLDRLFDFMLDSRKIPNDDDLLYYKKPALTGRNMNVTIPDQIDLLYTTDYPMVHPDRKIKPVQGGFVILRPNQTIYDDFVNIVKVGDFQFEGNSDLGWGGRSGRFWGAMTFQGLMPYYFHVLHPGRALELNWCIWNNMCSPSYDTKKNDPNYRECFTQQENCEDCRLRPIEEIGLIHFTFCQKPWLCHSQGTESDEDNLCRAFHHAWFKTRSAMEVSWGRTGNGTSNFKYDHFLGYCSSHGKHGYQSIQKPYGRPVK